MAERLSQAIGLVVLGAGALGAAGCGSAAVTHAQYLARAGAICEATARAVRAVAPPAAGPVTATGLPPLSALAAYTSRARPLLADELARLRALPEPPGDRANLVAWLASLSRDESAFAALTRAARVGDTSGAQTALVLLRTSQSERFAAQDGITGCASAATVP